MTMEELAKQNKAHGMLLGQIVGMLNKQKTQETDPIQVLLKALGGEVEEKPKTALEQLTEALKGQQQAEDPTQQLIAALTGATKKAPDTATETLTQLLGGAKKDESQEGILGAVLTPIAERLDALTAQLTSAETKDHRSGVNDALKLAAAKAGIKSESAQSDVIRLYSQTFDLIDGNLVMVKDGKAVDDPKQPGVKIGFDHFNTELKTRSPHFYEGGGTEESTDLFSMFDIDANGNKTIDTNGKVEINITDVDRAYTEEEDKAIAAGNHVYVMD